jgi:hypothetical protein
MTSERDLLFGSYLLHTRAALMAQSVEHWTLTRGARVQFPAVAVGVVVLSKPDFLFGSLSRWIVNE